MKAKDIHSCESAARMASLEDLWEKIEGWDPMELIAAVKRLPERLRTVTALRIYGGMSPSQVGDMIGASELQIHRLEVASMRSLRAEYVRLCSS